MIPLETVAMLRDRTDLVALVLESVPSLKRRGRSWVGLCPFHKERTPSFNVNQDRGFFKCFGCGESGDAFTFVMKEYGYTFHEAAHFLAERAGVAIEEPRQPSESRRVRKYLDGLYAANAVAATWFEEQLRKHPLRAFALEELARRGIVPGENAAMDEALRAFRVGYAPHEWDGLATYFREQGISPVAAVDVGLLAPRPNGGGHYDCFRHRLMFPILDPQGRVVAFSGRTLPAPSCTEPTSGGEGAPKYLNSKESLIYTKRNVLFGLFQARHAVRREELAVVVEGNFDVFSLHARGLANVVAPLGTAFTPEQAALLKRYAPKGVLLFDGDAAGRRAARAARGPCMAAGLEVKVASLPDGEDPDVFCRTRGAEYLRFLCAGAKGMLEFLIDAELDASFVAADSRERLARVERIAALIASEDDPLSRTMAKAYVDSVAGRLDILGPDPFRALELKLRKTAYGPRPEPSFETDGEDSRRSSTPSTAAAAERRRIVGALLDCPSLLEDPEVVAACVHLEEADALTVSILRRAYASDCSLNPAALLGEIPPTIRTFVEDRLAVPEHDSDTQAKRALLASARRLEQLNIAREIDDISRDLEENSDLQRLQEAQVCAERAKGIKLYPAPHVRSAGPVQPQVVPSREGLVIGVGASAEAVVRRLDCGQRLVFELTGPGADAARTAAEAHDSDVREHVARGSLVVIVGSLEDPVVQRAMPVLARAARMAGGVVVAVVAPPPPHTAEWVKASAMVVRAVIAESADSVLDLIVTQRLAVTLTATRVRTPAEWEEERDAQFADAARAILGALEPVGVDLVDLGEVYRRGGAPARFHAGRARGADRAIVAMDRALIGLGLGARLARHEGGILVHVRGGRDLQRSEVSAALSRVDAPRARLGVSSSMDCADEEEICVSLVVTEVASCDGVATGFAD